ncbi:MAG TPA: nucleotidyltransferase family protein [Gemmatimonadaceae bacterium]|nr:nucleotidyltransferase family protein [Gemmatimonadaceae bacterium]
MTSWSPELELVARVSRIAPTPEDAARARALLDGAPDWERILRLVHHHGVAPLVHANVSRLGASSVPVGMVTRLRQLRLASVRSDLALYTAWQEACDAFRQRGLPALTLKGFHVVLSIYGEVGQRAVGDLDFLVQRHDVRPALDVLRDLGYQPFPDWQAALRNVGLDHVLKATHEIGLVSDRGIVVDLHWEAGPCGTVPPARDLFDSAEPLVADGREALVPALDAAMAMLLLHGHVSAWARLRWLVDVAEGMERMSAGDVERVARRLDALGMRPAMANALQLMRRLWGRVPQACAESGQHEAAIHSLTLQYSERALDREQDAPHVFDLWRPVRMLWDRAGRARSLGDAVRAAVAPNYFDWAAVPLPRGLRAGYYAVRPVRVLRQALGRGARATLVEPVASRPPAATPSRAPFTFVSAIYDSGPESLLGGRGWGIEFYLPSLVNIGKMGAPIVIFCPQRDARKVEDAIAPHFTGYRVIPCELSEFEHYAQFVAWKPSYVDSLSLNNRNEVLCFLKSYWVQRAVAERPFGHERYFWIDAGFTHHGIFPERVGGVELKTAVPPSHYWPQNPANIFRPELAAALEGAVPRGRVMFCALPFNRRGPHGAAYEAVTAARYRRAASDVRILDHLVGGLFGGHEADLRNVHRGYAELLTAFLDARTYTLEEQVFSSLHAVRPELFTLLRFGVWRFHAPGEPNHFLEQEGDSFYKIFTGLLAAQESAARARSA